MILLDTNILVYATIPGFEEHARARELLREEICRGAAPVVGNVVHDCRIAAIMRENGVADILTRDTFGVFPGSG